MNIKLKPIAESKIRQMGGDVCGVLVRKDDKLAAVDEHGRVQWLQSGQGADPIGSPGSLQRAKAVFAAYREDFPRFGKRLDGTPAINDLPVRVAKAFSDLCPQPAQQGSVPSRDDLIQCLLATQRQSEGVMADAILSMFTAAPTAQQGSVPEGWRECLTEMVQAMHDYEMSVDEDAPYKHRAMMDRAHALLSTPATPQLEGDGWIAVPREAVEYLKDQWPGAYARFYEKIDELRRPQPPKEGSGDE